MTERDRYADFNESLLFPVKCVFCMFTISDMNPCCFQVSASLMKV